MSNTSFIPVVAALIQDEQGRFLLARRKSHLKNGGCWEFPGGKLEAGESPEKCLVREIGEELSIRISVDEIFFVVNRPLKNRCILLLCYFCTWVDGQIRLSDHDQADWLTPPEMLRYSLTAADREVVEKLIQIDSH